MSFSDKQDIKLIRNVKENPVLYDNNHTRYMDYNEREVIWQKIGDELRRPAAECKARWINIRDIYRRKLRKQMNNPGQCRKSYYKYEKEISFLRSYFREVVPHPCTEFEDNPEFDDNTNNIDFGDTVIDQDDCVNDDDSSEDSDEKKPIRLYTKTTASNTPSNKKKKKRKRAALEKVLSSPASLAEAPVIPGPSEFDPSDPVDAFLLSIGATLKTFSPYHLNVAKSKIFAVVQEHDLKQIVDKQSPNVLQPSQSDVKLCSVDPIYEDV